MALIFFGGLGNVVNFMYQGKYKILLQAEGNPTLLLILQQLLMC